MRNKVSDSSSAQDELIATAKIRDGISDTVSLRNAANTKPIHIRLP